MAIADEWNKVDEAFNRLQQYRVLHPTLIAMRKLVDLLRSNSAFHGVHPSVSMASLVLARDHKDMRVSVAWRDDSGYRVTFVNSRFEFTEATAVREDDVIRVLKDYLVKLQ